MGDIIMQIITKTVQICKEVTIRKVKTQHKVTYRTNSCSSASISPIALDENKTMTQYPV